MPTINLTDAIGVTINAEMPSPDQGGISAVIVGGSLTGNGLPPTPVQLFNDNPSPPPNSYYGTDANQALGYHPLAPGNITYSRFTAENNISFGTTYPAFNIRGPLGIPVLTCPDAATTDCLFLDIMLADANLSQGLTTLIKWTAHTAVIGNAKFNVAFQRLNGSIASLAFDTFGTVLSTTSPTVDTVQTAVVPSLITLNNLTPGDLYAVKVSRDGTFATDTLLDSVEILAVEIRSAAI